MTGASQPGNGHREDAAARSAYIKAGLSVIGLEAGPDEIAIIEAVDAIYGRKLRALMVEGFDDIPHEPGADMSQPPRTAEER